ARSVIGWVFCFQAEDGIRGWSVTGVQTCALPISSPPSAAGPNAQTPRASSRAAAWPRYAANAAKSSRSPSSHSARRAAGTGTQEIGRASCREREESAGGAVVVKEEDRRHGVNRQH